MLTAVWTHWPGMTTQALSSETYRMQCLPIAMTHREAAFAGIIAKKIWYCPWKGVLNGQRLTKARAAVIRGVRPGLASTSRLASLVTAFCLKGHVSDPVMISVLGILRWIQTMGEKVALHLHLLHSEDYTPTGPWTSLRFLCGELGIHSLMGLRTSKDIKEWRLSVETPQKGSGFMSGDHSCGWPYPSSGSLGASFRIWHSSDRILSELWPIIVPWGTRKRNSVSKWLFRERC